MSQADPHRTPHSQDRARARTFGEVASLYDAARPDYPAAALRWILGDTPLDVVDLGAGTGKLTRLLAALGHRVQAVEPSARMREVLTTVSPELDVLTGSAERIPLPDASVDAVVAGQAYHWFDTAIANAEIARVLRPGGRVGLLWNVRDEDVAWVARMSRILYGAEQAEDGSQTVSHAERDLSGDFVDIEHREFRHEQELTLASFLDLIRSRSRVIQLSDDEREQLLRELTDLVRTSLPENFSMPYITSTYRARVPG